MKGGTFPNPSGYMWREGKYDGLSIDAQRADKTGLEEKAGQAAATTEEAHGYPLYIAGPGQLERFQC